jgi:hypothetical protein
MPLQIHGKNLRHCQCTYESIFCSIQSYYLTTAVYPLVKIRDNCPCFNCLIKMSCTRKCDNRMEVVIPIITKEGKIK